MSLSADSNCKHPGWMPLSHTLVRGSVALAHQETRLKSALMTLASIAKPSPATSPSLMQRRSTLSKK